MLLNKDNVLKKIGETQIFERYLGFSVSLHTKYRNPLRPDTNPGCFFRESGNRIYFCDYAQPEYGGDCFKIVQILYNCDFYAALQIINVDFNLKLEDKYADEIQYSGSNITLSISLPNSQINSFRKTQFSVRIMSFLEQDLAWWNEFGIRQSTLEKFNVHSCYESYINSQLYHRYSLSDPQYAYIFPDDYVKVYRPKSVRKELKFRTNAPAHILQGYEQLPGYADHLIITSSLKDVMTLYECGYHAVAPQSENTMIPENLVDQVQYRFANIYILYDNDTAGINAANRLSECCGFNIISLPQNALVKDPSDFVKAFGKQPMLQFLNENIIR